MPDREHWAFRPVKHHTPPAVHDRAWVQSPVDAFVLARLEKEGLTPSPPADRRTLIRRATIDLLGIPPTAEEVEAFEADARPTPSPAWSTGCWPRPSTASAGAGTGSTWPATPTPRATSSRKSGAIRSPTPTATTSSGRSTHDLPYDRFVLEQLAADQLDLGDDRRPLAAMGFLTVGRRFLNDQNEIIDDRIDVVGRGLLGLTVACARCHDHKFDPIPTRGLLLAVRRLRQLGRARRAAEAGTARRAARRDRRLSSRSSKRRRKKPRRLTWPARRDEFENDLRARFSQYLKAAYDLELDARDPQARRARRGRQAGLAQRLRAVISLWKRRLDARRRRARPGPRPLATRSPRCPKDAVRRQGGRASHAVSNRGARQGQAGSSRWSLGVPGAARRRPWARSCAVRRAAGRARRRCREQDREDRSSRGGRWPSPSGSRCARRVFGPAGLAVDSRRRRHAFVLDRAERSSSSSWTTPSSSSRRSRPGSAGRGDGAATTRPGRSNPHVFIRGNPGRPGQGGSAAVPQGALRPGAQAVREGERPAGAGPGDRRARATR